MITAWRKAGRNERLIFIALVATIVIVAFGLTRVDWSKASDGRKCPREQRGYPLVSFETAYTLSGSITEVRCRYGAAVQPEEQ